MFMEYLKEVRIYFFIPFISIHFDIELLENF